MKPTKMLGQKWPVPRRDWRRDSLIQGSIKILYSFVSKIGGVNKHHQLWALPDFANKA